ncbi:MAG: nitrite reductase [Peptococcaceae bacterium]|nr:nitrite reductase [Peptococcaceae bacterium]
MGSAVFQQNDGMVAIVAVTQCGLITGEQFIKLSELIKVWDIPALKLTTRQTIIVLCKPEQVNGITENLKEIGLQVGGFGGVVRNIKGCCGSPNLCERYLSDALGVGIEIQEKFFNQTVPKDFKIATAGCVRGCTDPYCADFGVVGSGKEVFDVYIGGRGGSPKPQHGALIAKKIDRADVINLLEHVLTVYRREGQAHERLCRTIARIGLDQFKLAIETKAAVDNNFLLFLGGTKREQ